MRSAIQAIRSSVLMHLEHITKGGDPFEAREARPLDFGHWSAHKLEALSGYALRHGEAVSIGVALDTAYSTLKFGLPQEILSKTLDTLANLQLPVSILGSNVRLSSRDWKNSDNILVVD